MKGETSLMGLYFFGVAVLMGQFTLPDGGIVLVDDADLAWISELAWHRHRKPGKRTDYVAANVLVNGQRKHLPLHRFVMGVRDPEVFVDHANHDGLDNRRSNLRLCSQAENTRNQLRDLPGKSSKFKGVIWNKQLQKWAGQIKAAKKKYHLGYFESEQQAAQAYNTAAMQLHGEFASLN